MGMFVTSITGPASAEGFSAAFVEEVRPRLEQVATIGAWQDLEGNPYIVGYTDENPERLINNALGGRGWQVQTLFLGPIGNLPPPNVVTIHCDMPFNRHVVSATPRVCGNGHDFSDDHQINNCPVCGSKLI